MHIVLTLNIWSQHTWKQPTFLFSFDYIKTTRTTSAIYGCNLVIHKRFFLRYIKRQSEKLERKHHVSAMLK